MSFKSVFVALGIALAASASVAGELTRWVCPFAGTVGTGNTFPGACRPFGMVQPGPDTTDVHNPSGYERDQPTIRGFSATHLNGTGCAALGDVVLMPFTGETNGVDFGSPWDKAKEKAAPGYYAVTLDRFGTTAEITATERVAIYRFAWPKGAVRKLLVDGATFLRDPWYAKDGQSIPSSCGGLSEDRREIAGSREFVSWVRAEVHYAVRFSRPVDTLVKLPRDGFEGAGDRWVCTFAADDEPLEVRVAVSSVSPDGARGNFAEAEGKTFDAVRAEADAEWESYLGRATIEGTDEQKRCFYTALYRLFIQPNNMADLDGRYRGADGKVHTAKAGRFYTTFSLWDTFRAAHPLYTILVPERIPGFIDTFMDHARAHGHLPAWSLWGREAHCMIGMHSIPVLADAWAKGFRNFDPEEALGYMVNSMIGSDKCWPKMDWGSYFEHGYLPCRPGPYDKGFVPGESVSRTLEYAYDWWCVSRFARQIGAEATARKADRWAAGWREVIDPETGFARGRAPGKGGWRTPFDPLENAQAGEFHGDYTEANAWIYTWHVFQDPDGLAERLGGREKALAKLDRFFATAPVRKEKVGGNNDLGGVAGDGQIGQYWHGNEPSHHIAYLYTAWGRPEKTAALVKRICAEAYKSKDDGLVGNDDCGQMSAWYVFSTLGFYSLNPCGGEYVIGAPQVPMAQVKVGGEGERRTFKVLAKGLSKENEHVESVTLNGRAVTDWRIRHEDVVKGGELVFRAPKTVRKPTIRERKDAFERSCGKPLESAKLTFIGADGWDVYNCSIPFTWNGVRYIFGRLEKHEIWTQSHIALFRETAKDVWTKEPAFVELELEDPYVQTVKGELVIGGTFIRRDQDGKFLTYLGRFYRGKDPFSLVHFADGPDKMKDIRIAELPNGRIGVFSRPRGEEVRAKWGSEAVIGYTEIASLDEFNADLVQNAPIIPGLFGKDEWGGVNQAYALKDGRILVAAHLSCGGAPATNGIPRQIYMNASFVFDPKTFTATEPKIVATRRFYPANEPKVPHLDDCVFTSGFVFREDGLVDVYTGLCDADEARCTIPGETLGVSRSLLFRPLE